MSSRALKALRLARKGSSGSPKRDRTISGSPVRYPSSGDEDSSEAEDSTAMDGNFFAGSGLQEFLDSDPRPTFVLDPNADFAGVLDPVFSNSALRSNIQLMKVLSIKTKIHSTASSPKVSSTEFRAWLREVCQLDGIDSLPSSSFPFWGFQWSAYMFRDWLLVSGSGTNREPRAISRAVSSPPPPASESLQTLPSRSRLSRSSSEDDAADEVVLRPYTTDAQSTYTSGTRDWTLPQPEDGLTPHVIFARSIDWSATALGDMSTWTPQFRQLVCLLMNSPFPAAIFWGEEMIVIYNEAYAKQVAGIKHPGLMGTGFKGPFAEVWNSLESIFAECRHTGKAVAVDNQLLPIDRRGFDEETYFTWSLTPLYGGTDTVQGLYNTPFETTRQKVSERRTRTLLKLGELVSLAKSVSSFWVQILKALEDNEYDFPFALLYSVVDDTESDESGSMSSESSQSMKSCVLEGMLGVPDGHPSAPTRLELKRARGGFIPSFREAMQTREPKLLNISDGTLDKSLVDGFQWRGFPESCRLAVVCPIRPTTGENVLGFLVVGINSRRPYDEDYQAFISLLNRQLATSLASVTLFEEEIRRGLTTEVERTRLSDELAIQRSRLHRIAEVSLVGMFSLSDTGLILDSNDRWFEMTGHPKASLEISWAEILKESSAIAMEDGWKRLLESKHFSAELELKTLRLGPNGEELDSWILLDCQPELDEDGKVRTILGSCTDISPQKRSAKDAEARARLSEQLLLRTQEAEALQKQRLKEAEETRRQQNNFIDITSHEMRNPLSAIVQCADSISISMKEYNANHDDLDSELAAIIKANTDAADTIQLCAQHQKSIVDDILTISKLDSKLLLITPVPVQPVKIMEQCLKMFKSEVQVCDIKIEFQIGNSITRLNVDKVMLDSSRLLQVLINLLTNAIKFTKSEKTRTIIVTLSAHVNPPKEGLADFQYFPTNRERTDFISGADWGSGEILYLRWEVRDTGCGLSESEKKNLFTRFSQASPRTHVQYGGSGLGLFISRQLTELQGGEIGVASEAGVGSTFAFYLKIRRVEGDMEESAEARLSDDLQSSARLAVNVPKDLRTQDGTVSKLLQQYSSTASSGSSTSLSSHSPILDTSTWHVLIVEDNLVNQRILAQQIKKLGCTVHVANHGEEALTMLRETRHYKGKEEDGKELSVILMDLEMPVMDGLTCVRRIRQLEAEGMLRVRLPIIAVTANARGEQVAAARDSGMDDVMPKPFRIKQLVPKIEALLVKLQEQTLYCQEGERRADQGQGSS